MDVWDWVDDCRKRFQAAGDAARLRLTGIHPIAYKLRETDPDRALALFEVPAGVSGPTMSANLPTFRRSLATTRSAVASPMPG